LHLQSSAPVEHGHHVAIVILIGLGLGIFRQGPDFLGHHRKAPSSVARVGHLNRRVHRQEVGPGGYLGCGTALYIGGQIKDTDGLFYSSREKKPAFITEDNHRVKIRIVYDKNTRRVLGTQMASYQDISMGIHLFSLAIEEKVTIDKLKLLDIFFLPHFNQPYNYITMAALSAK
jgi:hypothetical protein